jgi:transposase
VAFRRERDVRRFAPRFYTDRRSSSTGLSIIGGVATRYEKLGANFLAMVNLDAVRIWLRQMWKRSA